jgi:23S rRNA (cytosine1962-C5)-methyltransferase
MVDRFADVAIIHTTAEAIPPDVRAQVESVCPTAYLKVHPRTPREYIAHDNPLWGPPRAEVIVTEHGAKYLVKPTSGLTVGLFLDMREVRQWLRASTRGLSVLNLFAYTCSFGVCATLAGAARVVNVDLSKSYLEWGKENYRLNDCVPEDRDFIYGDAFDWLRRFARRGQGFDVVIMDPPSFSSTPFSIARDYPRLVSNAAAVVAPGGTLLAATNHAQTSELRFDTWLDEGLTLADRRGRLEHDWHEPEEDFPVPKGGRSYLKVRALRLD